MANENIKKVSQLRKATGCKIKDVMEALESCQGDIEEAKVYLRKKGLASAGSKSHRETGEGLVVHRISDNRQQGVAVSLLCETDFVAKNERFTTLVAQIADVALANGITDIETLKTQLLAEDSTVEDEIKLAIAKFGENIVLGDCRRLESAGPLVAYQHGDKIAVLVALSSDTQDEVGRDVAMHIAAMRPVAVDRDSLPAGYLDEQREVFKAQVAELNANKPAEMMAKIAEGKLDKHLSQVVLTDQIFVKDPDGKQTVAAFLKSHGAKIHDFVRLTIGE